MKDAKDIAFAIVLYEDFVHAILPRSRKENKYCPRNSKSEGSGLQERAESGMTAASVWDAKVDIIGISSLNRLISYMQNDRYVLWNFQNIYPRDGSVACSHTLEFRGASQFLNTQTTLRWIAFAVAFINLALEEVSQFERNTLHSSTMFNNFIRAFSTPQAPATCLRPMLISTRTLRPGGSVSQSQLGNCG